MITFNKRRDRLLYKMVGLGNKLDSLFLDLNMSLEFLFSGPATWRKGKFKGWFLKHEKKWWVKISFLGVKTIVSLVLAVLYILVFLPWALMWESVKRGLGPHVLGREIEGRISSDRLDFGTLNSLKQIGVRNLEVLVEKSDLVEVLWGYVVDEEKGQRDPYIAWFVLNYGKGEMVVDAAEALSKLGARGMDALLRNAGLRESWPDGLIDVKYAALLLQSPSSIVRKRVLLCLGEAGGSLWSSSAPEKNAGAWRNAPRAKEFRVGF